MISDALGVPAVRRYYDPQLQNFPHRQVAQDAFLAGNDLLEPFAEQKIEPRHFHLHLVAQQARGCLSDLHADITSREESSASKPGVEAYRLALVIEQTCQTRISRHLEQEEILRHRRL